jgi:hypothetical protein
MPYSPDEIQVIHQQAIAEPDRRYSSFDGQTYVGTKTGRLKLLDESIVELERELEETQNTLANALEEARETLQEGIDEIASEEKNSYVELDINFDVMPKEAIDQLLFLNILELNTLNGELSPSLAGDQDLILELNEDNEIKIKNF